MATAAKTGIYPRKVAEEYNSCPENLAPCLLRAWKIFHALSAVRRSNGYAPDAINYQDILAYMTLMNVEDINDFEVEAIIGLDACYLEFYASKK